MRIAICALVCLFLNACAHGGKNYDDASVAKVRKTAVVGYTLLQAAAVKDIPMPQMPGGMTNGFIPGINSFPKINEHSEDVLALCEKLMKDKKKWTVVPPAQVKSNAAYASLFAEKMHNWKNKIAPRKDTQLLFADGLLDQETAVKLSQFERDQLMQALGVDALAVVKVDVALKSGGLSFNGIGDGEHPFATAYFTLYAKGVDKPIWSGWHETKGGEQSVPKNVEQERMDQLSKASAKIAFSELLTNTEKDKE